MNLLLDNCLKKINVQVYTKVTSNQGLYELNFTAIKLVVYVVEKLKT